MDIYRFPPSSLLDEITVVPNENGAKRAYLHAVESATPQQLNQVKDKLTLSGIQVVPSHYDGKPVLEARGFGEDKKLLSQLAQFESTDGKPQHEQPLQGDEPKTLWQKFTKNTLQRSGYLYLVGDACYMKYGYNGARNLDVLAGIMYLMGSSSLMAYGKNDTGDLQVRDLSKEMVKQATAAGMKMPADCSLSAITRDEKKGLIGNADELLRRYPSEAMNTFFGLAGMCIAASAIKHHELLKPNTHHSLRHKIVGWLDVGLGSMTALSGAISTLVKEKKHDPEEPQKQGLGRILEWVQEKPLRVAGYGYIISTLCHAGSTTLDMIDARKTGDRQRLQSIPYRAAFVGANLVAEFLMSISSKGHGEGVTSDDSVKESMYSVAAELLLKQPANIREAQLQYLVNFLEHPSALAEKREVVEEKLRARMAELEKNPWLCKALAASEPAKPDSAAEKNKPEQAAAISAVPPAPVVSHAQRAHAPHTEHAGAHWQQKVRTPAASAAVHSL